MAQGNPDGSRQWWCVPIVSIISVSPLSSQTLVLKNSTDQYITFTMGKKKKAKTQQRTPTNQKDL